MRPVIIDLPDHTKNDTWEGLSIGPVTFNNSTPTYPVSACRMHFRTKDGTLGQEFTSSNSTITITVSGTWEIEVSPQVLSLTEGTWKWDFETTDTQGYIRTLYAGTIRIFDDVTY